MTQSLTSNKLHNHLVRLSGETNKRKVIMGQLLYGIRKKGVRNAVGEGIETWQAYLAQPEIGLTVSEANRLVQIYQQFVLRLGMEIGEVAEIPFKNLQYLLPLVKKNDNDEEVREMIDEAKTLSQRDFKERIYERKHEDEEQTYTYLVMKKSNQTGNMTKVHGIESEEIKEKFNLE